jgi:hypothetical protein
MGASMLASEPAPTSTPCTMDDVWVGCDELYSCPIANHNGKLFTSHPPTYNDAFTLDVKSALNENLGGILGGT